MVPRAFVARGDVEEAELVGAGRVIGARRSTGIAGVAQVDGIDALDDPAVLDVEAGDDADLEHRNSAMAFQAKWGPVRVKKTRQNKRAQSAVSD